MAPAPQAWPRAVRLKRRRLIRPLFAHGRGDTSSISTGTVRLLYRIVPQHQAQKGSGIQVAFAVARRRTSVSRNRIRRVLRETFRTSAVRPDLCARPGYTLTLMVLCRSRGSLEMSDLRADLELALSRLAANLQG